MTKKNATKSALLMSVLALMLCFTMLLGTTFAWFTDSATSTGNKIQAGTLKIDLELLENGAYTSVRDMTDPIFNYEKWEPGYTVVKTMKIANEGSLALKYQLNVTAENSTSILANVIDVYMCFGESTAQSAADLADTTKWWKCGTLAEMLANPEGFTQGKLLPAGATYNDPLYGQNGVAIGEITASVALHMREEAGNEYQGLDLGNVDVQLIATQFTYEEDSFDDQYDKDTILNFTPVANVNELKAALTAEKENILLTANIVTSETFTVEYDAVIDGAGKTISRADGNTAAVFTVAPSASLTLNNVIVDGGAVWANSYGLRSGSVTNAGATATTSLIVAEANADIVLNEGAILQNNDGAVAVNLGTRIGATLTLNGGEIIHNRSNCGAVWGGGHITINSGKISYNSSTGIAGAIRMVSNCNLTMNGGEISYNTAATNGGAIWGSGVSTYNFNGGSMSYNTAAVGGAIYTGDNSTINMSGTFELCNNTADDAGAIRFTNGTTFKMSGGTISGNISTNSPAWNGFYGWNVYPVLTGGTIADDITIQCGYIPTVGGANVTGTIHFAVNTNHNTINLVKDFNTFKFTVAEGANFSAFNLKAAADYVYTAGDEAKLICLNDGYTTYWNAEKGAFCLKAVE